MLIQIGTLRDFDVFGRSERPRASTGVNKVQTPATDPRDIV